MTHRRDALRVVGDRPHEVVALGRRHALQNLVDHVRAVVVVGDGGDVGRDAVAHDVALGVVAQALDELLYSEGAVLRRGDEGEVWHERAHVADAELGRRDLEELLGEEVAVLVGHQRREAGCDLGDDLLDVVAEPALREHHLQLAARALVARGLDDAADDGIDGERDGGGDGAGVGVGVVCWIVDWVVDVGACIVIIVIVVHHHHVIIIIIIIIIIIVMMMVNVVVKAVIA